VTSQTVLHRWSRPTKHQHDWQAFHRAQLWVMTLSDFYEPSKPHISSLRSWCHSKESLPCPSMIHRTSTVHLYTVYLI
jgi:hypothetical protein